MLMEANTLVEIPAAEYHADKDVVGHSALVEMLRSPQHFWHRLNALFEPTPAMALGTAVHTAVLEPAKFAAEYSVAPKFDRRTKDGKEAYAQWQAANVGKLFITDEEMATCHAIVGAIAQHQAAAEALGGSLNEMSYFWRDAETGVRCRIRPDALVVDEAGEIQAIVDLKTCRDASAGKFARTIAERGYDLQAAFYVDGLSKLLGRRVPFYFLAAETYAPHGVALYSTGERTFEVGRSKYKAALQMVQWCRENNRWPSYQPFGDAEEIDVPHWEKMLYDSEDE